MIDHRRDAGRSPRPRDAWHIALRAPVAPCFTGEADYRFYLRCLQEAAARYRCAVHAYGLTPHGAHIVLTPSAPGAERDAIRAINGRYALYRLRKLRGGFVGDTPRWTAIPVEAESHLFVSQMHVELLPVRLGLTERVGDYAWTSHAANALGRTDACVTPHPYYQHLGATPEERRDTYRSLFELQLAPSLWRRVDDALAAGEPLGEPDFVRRHAPGWMARDGEARKTRSPAYW